MSKKLFACFVLLIFICATGGFDGQCASLSRDETNTTTSVDLRSSAGGCSDSDPLLQTEHLSIETTSLLPGATVGRAYKELLRASGGTPPYKWNAAGTLPPGLKVKENGEISGTPTAVGPFSFTVQVRSKESVQPSNPISKTLSIKVAAPVAMTKAPAAGAAAKAPPGGGGATAAKAPVSGEGASAKAPVAGGGATAKAPVAGGGATAKAPASGGGATAKAAVATAMGKLLDDSDRMLRDAQAILANAEKSKSLIEKDANTLERTMYEYAQGLDAAYDQARKNNEGADMTLFSQRVKNQIPVLQSITAKTGNISTAIRAGAIKVEPSLQSRTARPLLATKQSQAAPAWNNFVDCWNRATGYWPWLKEAQCIPELAAALVR